LKSERLNICYDGGFICDFRGICNPKDLIFIIREDSFCDLGGISNPKDLIFIMREDFFCDFGGI
jgi:hypothetical protein